MQSASSRIWTCIAVSISYDDNHYTTGTSKVSICAGSYVQVSATVENPGFEFGLPISFPMLITIMLSVSYSAHEIYA